MKTKALLSLLLLAISAGITGEALARVTSSGARSSSVSISRSYSPARPSYSGAAAKPSSARKQPSTTAPASSKPASTTAAPATTSTSQQSHSGSFWTPLLIGYMLAPSSSHASTPSAPKSATNAAATNTAPAQQDGPVQAEAAKPPVEQKTGPFTLDIPGRELLDENCHVKPAAKDFINGAKIEKSVLFITLPDGGRCEDSRAKLRAELAPAILVRSENGNVQLIRMIGQQ